MNRSILLSVLMICFGMVSNICFGNMLSNSGFEQGLDLWAPGSGASWPVPPVLDSAVSHSGANSVKFFGTGSGQGMISQNVAVNSNASVYRIAGWVKCSNLAADWSGSIRAEFYNSGGTFLGIVSSELITGTADWTYVNAAFKVPADAATITVYGALRNDGSADNSGSVWFDDIELTVLPAPNITTGGESFFPICLYFVGEKMYQEVADAGFNSIFIYCGGLPDATYKAQIADAYNNYGLRGWVQMRSEDMGINGNGNLTNIENYVNYFADTPGLIGWCLGDEPELWSNLNFTQYAQAADLIATLDPKPRVTVNTYGMSQTAFLSYIPHEDIVSTDCYPGFEVGNPDTGNSAIDVCILVTDILRAASGGEKPVLMVQGLQNTRAFEQGPVGDASDHDYRMASLEELRNLTYGSIIHGSKNAMYWMLTTYMFDVRECPQVWKGTKALAGELNFLAPALLTEDSTKVVSVSSSPAVKMRYLIKDYEGYTYLFMMNEGDAASNVTMSIDGVTSGSVYVVSEARNLSVVGGSFSDSFSPKAVHIYSTNPNTPSSIIGSLQNAWVEDWASTGTYPSVPADNFAHYRNGGSASASSCVVYARTSAAINGSYGAAQWRSTDAAPWIEIEMNQPRTIDHIKICSNGTSAYAFTFEYWDGEAWQNVRNTGSVITFKKWDGSVNDFIDCPFADPNVECRINDNTLESAITTNKIKITFPQGVDGIREIEFIEAQPAPIAGDANSDGIVDVGDLGILAANYGTVGVGTWSTGDFNGDFAVDVGDLGILASNYGSGSSAVMDYDADYKKIFGDKVIEEDTSAKTEETEGSPCSFIGLGLIVGLAIVGFVYTKLKSDKA